MKGYDPRTIVRIFVSAGLSAQAEKEELLKASGGDQLRDEQTYAALQYGARTRAAGLHLMTLGTSFRCRSTKSMIAPTTRPIRTMSTLIAEAGQAALQPAGLAARSLTDARVSPVTKTHIVKNIGVGQISDLGNG